MIEHIQYFQKGTVYRIRNRKTKRDLCLCSKLQLKTEQTQECPDQLWIINQLKHGEYEIVQLKTGTVLTQKTKKREMNTKIAKRTMADNQLWNIIFAENDNQIDYFWIKPIDNEQLTFSASSLDKDIRITSIQPTLNICLWQAIPYPQQKQLLADLCFIKSQHSNLVLQVPEYASNQGVNIIQYLQTGGGNQRWKIQPYEQKQKGTKEYTIRNYSSGLNLTAVFTKNSFKVIQSFFNCNPDQRWSIIPTKNKSFLLQCVSNNQYYLGIGSDRGGTPVNLLQDKLKSLWMIQGHNPAS